MAKSAPKKDPKNDFIDFIYCAVSRSGDAPKFRGPILAPTTPRQPSHVPVCYGARSNNLPHFANAVISALRIAVVLASLVTLADGEPVHERKRIAPISTPENPAVASELVDVVTAYIAAGEQDDPTARGKYLGPKVFYYGHARTHQQAVREITALYRRWPQRKFALTESIDLFEIPNHHGVYRVTAVYEYKFENQNEHLSGKSKLTCVVEHDQQGTRITGVDEKLVSGSTVYQGK